MYDQRAYCVYILSNDWKNVIYIGVTNDLIRRVEEHRNGKGSQFTTRYHVKNLVYYEATEDIRTAIEREKELKGWRRAKKNALINSMNPMWKDLYPELLD